MRIEKSVRAWISVPLLSVFLLLCASATAQVAKSDGAAPAIERITLRMGARSIVIPSPEGFEEAAGKFPNVRPGFTSTEPQGNDMLAVHLPKSDCDRLRQGGSGPFSFYTKISVQTAIREQDYPAAQFAAIPTEFRKNGAALLDLNGPRMKAAVERAEGALNRMGDSRVSMGQPVNLGEFDDRPNVYSVMLMMTLNVQDGGAKNAVPLLCTVSFVRVNQRLLYVYAYRRYESNQDALIIRDFAKHWVDMILAAN